MNTKNLFVESLKVKGPKMSKAFKGERKAQDFCTFEIIKIRKVQRYNIKLNVKG